MITFVEFKLIKMNENKRNFKSFLLRKMFGLNNKICGCSPVNKNVLWSQPNIGCFT